MFGRLATVVLVLIFSVASGQTPDDQSAPRPATGIQSFEHSQFCRENDCFLKNIEPSRINGEITDWYYDYRVSPKSDSLKPREYQMRIGMRLMPEEGRSFPQIVVRWFPVNSPPDREFPIISNLVREVTGDSKFDTTKYLTDYAKRVNYHSGPNIEHGPNASVGKHALRLSISRGADKCRYPQLTLIID